MEVMDKQKLIADLIIDEGLELFPYKCTAGKLSIGIGRNLDDNWLTNDELFFIGIKEKTKEDIIKRLYEKGITKGDAMYLCENDVDNVVKQLRKNFFAWYDLAPEPIQRASCNLCFNIGINRLLGFKKTIAFLKEKKYEEASKEILNSKWASQVGQRSTRISNLIKQAI
jgi:lysozyme